MAHFGKDIDNITAQTLIKIDATETLETYTVYVIEVMVGPYSWTVKHRYSDFYDLHEKLVSACKIDNGLIPRKKLFGNQTESFIKKRQQELEAYLKAILCYVTYKMPKCLATFLNFEKYEIHGITQVMAEELYNKGDMLLQTKEMYRTTPLHLYALSERLKLPEPTCESGDVKRDLGHILDFITRLKYLQISGGQKVGTSNIDVCQLHFDLSLFKSLQKLEIISCEIARIGGLDIVKQTLQTLSVNRSLKSIRELLLQDLQYWKADDGTVLVSYFDGITYLDLSRNSIAEIDDSMQLLPKLEHLDLSLNNITAIQNLHWLSNLTYLDLSHNEIEHLEALHSKLGNIKTLKLVENKLSSLQGLSKLFSLEYLDLSSNRISSVDDIKPVSKLPCLENLMLIGNPVKITLDYRTKTLALFGDRINELCLDKETCSQKEKDTVAVLLALQKSKDKVKEVNIKKVASSASVSELVSSASSSSYLGNKQSVVDTSSLLTITSPSLVPGSGIEQQAVAPQSLPHNTFRSQDHEEFSLASNILLTSSLPMQSAKEIKRISSKSHSVLPSDTYCVNTTLLPNHKSKEFSSWLHARFFGKENTSNNTVEQIRYVLWCNVVQYSNLESLLPCCVMLTERRVFILQLNNKESPFKNVPCMEIFYILPLCNIQQVVAGLCYSFVRIEESFVGASGMFTILAPDSECGKELLKELISCSDSSPENGKLDIVNAYKDNELSRQLSTSDEKKGVSFAAHVHHVESGSLLYLVLTEKNVFVIKSCVFSWPKPTFDTNELESLSCIFDVAEQYSVEAKNSEISKYSCIIESNMDKLHPVTSTLDIKFQEYGLSMVFHEILGAHKFDFHFLSSKSRDTFLNQLTILRLEHAHTMSPTLREEPEGGNESLEHSFDEFTKITKVYNQSKHNFDSKDSDIQYISEEDTNRFRKNLAEIDYFKLPKRKLRSKTEIPVVTKIVESLEDKKELPSYILHYLIPEVAQHLEACIKKYTLFQPLSSKLQALTAMSGHDLAYFFHTNIVPIGMEGEELHHVVWTNVIPYTNPKDEIITCVMLSNRAVYFVSDRQVKLHQIGGRPIWMTHARHVSDSVIGLQSKFSDEHHCSGILHVLEHSGAIVKPYCILDFADIQQINVGLFDQCLRITGGKRETVFTLVTRNSEKTNSFLQSFSTMLSLDIASPMLDKTSSDLEQDFYKAFGKRTMSTIEGMEYIHPSEVKFCYPGDEQVSDLLFLINEHLKSQAMKVGRENILQYLLGYRTQPSTSDVNTVLLNPTSIILTNECICFVTEDLVSYPLPDFVRGLPSMPRHHVSDIRKLEYLKFVTQNKSNPREITLVFSDENEDIILVPDHYSLLQAEESDSPPEIPFKLLIESERELSKFLLLIKSQWKEIHPEQSCEVRIFII